MMSVKVAMTDATELLGTLPLNQTSLLSGRAALLPGCPPPAVRAEAGRGPAGQAQSLAASALDKSETGRN